MLRRFSTARVAGFFLLDWLGTLAIVALAAVLRRDIGALPQPLAALAASWEIALGGARYSPSAFLMLGLPVNVYILTAVIWPAVFIGSSVYEGRRNPTLGSELRRVLTAACASLLVLAGMLFLTYRETSRLVFVLFAVLDVALLLGGRILLWAMRQTGGSQRTASSQSVLIIGAGAVGQRVAEQLEACSWTGIGVVGYLDDDPGKESQRLEGLPVLGTTDQMHEVVRSHGVNSAVVALPLHAHERLVEICRELQDMSVRVHVVPDLFALSFPGATLDGFGGIPVIDLSQPSVYGWRRYSKRAFDTILASLCLLVLSPLCLLVAILIKLESTGPVIFRQQRIGENGQPFTMLKFRSMRENADLDLHKKHVKRLIEEDVSPDDGEAAGCGTMKLRDDPRITRVGRIIRKLSIDELLQLVNVLRGEMSLVGPRPPLPYELERYESWQRRRLEALPGVTGWWQVKGRNRVSFSEAVRMDLYYIDHSSFWFDLKILLMTPFAVISRRGAG